MEFWLARCHSSLDDSNLFLVLINNSYEDGAEKKNSFSNFIPAGRYFHRNELTLLKYEVLTTPGITEFHVIEYSEFFNHAIIK